MYKNSVTLLAEKGHEVKVLGRDYGCTRPLLEYFDLDYEIYGRCETTKYSLFRELPVHYFNIFQKARAFDPDLIFGIGAYAAHAGAVTRTPVVNIFDSEPTTIDHVISRPFTNALLTPAAFEKNLGEKHYKFDGFKETAYLHPDVYSPPVDGVREELQIDDDEKYVVLRFNAFGSHHDIGKSGFTLNEKKRLIDVVSEYATVFVSDEGNQLDFTQVPCRPFDLHPAKMHDMLANAELLIADTQTMVTEAALLGTPAIRSNSFIGKSDMGNFKELEAQNLIHNERSLDSVLERSKEILTDPSAQQRWQDRREEYLRDKVNLTQLIVDIAIEFAESDSRIEDVIRSRQELV